MIKGASRMMLEIVTTFGAPEPMTHQELFSLMVAISWMLTKRVCESMRINSTRKREDQLHTFNWEATLMVPTAAGRRPERTSAGRSGEYYHVWFAGMPEVLKHFQHALFHAFAPSREMRRAFFTHYCRRSLRPGNTNEEPPALSQPQPMVSSRPGQC